MRRLVFLLSGLALVAITAACSLNTQPIPPGDPEPTTDVRGGTEPEFTDMPKADAGSDGGDAETDVVLTVTR